MPNFFNNFQPQKSKTRLPPTPTKKKKKILETTWILQVALATSKTLETNASNSHQT